MSDAPTKYFFRQRFQNHLYDKVVEALEAAAELGIRKKDIAARLGVNPSQISRWLSGPANWETDTVSDLLFAIDAEAEVRVVTFKEREQQKSNRFHLAGETIDLEPGKLQAKTRPPPPVLSIPNLGKRPEGTDVGSPSLMFA